MLEKLNFSLEMDQDMLIYSGHNIKTDLHAHFLISIVISKNEKFRIKNKDKTVETNFCIVPTNYLHEFESAINDHIVFIFLEPESRYPKLIKDQFELTDQIITFDTGVFEQQRKLLFKEAIVSIHTAKDFIDMILNSKSVFKIDDRILQSCHWIENNLDKKIEIGELSKMVFLSSSRFRNLFKQEIGISISKYIRWKRFKLAGRQLLEGDNFTQATYYAGFYDAPHFNRAFKEIFGITPFQVLK